MDLRSSARRMFARTGYDVHRITGDLGEDPYRDMRRLVTGSQPVTVDVGANIGQTVERLRATFEQPQIHSFEPSPATFAELERRTGSLPGVHLSNCALGAAPGTMELIENTHSDMSSMLEPGSEPWGEVKGRVEVPARTLDGYADEHGIERIDVLKSDTQGFDLEVLRGATDLLTKRRIRLVFLEVNFNDAYQGLPRLDEIYGFLHERGFRLVAFYSFHYQPDRASWADAMFINPEVR
jgi:FkbM family methyltransferase